MLVKAKWPQRAQVDYQVPGTSTLDSGVHTVWEVAAHDTSSGNNQTSACSLLLVFWFIAQAILCTAMVTERKLTISYSVREHWRIIRQQCLPFCSFWLCYYRYDYLQSMRRNNKEQMGGVSYSCLRFCQRHRKIHSTVDCSARWSTRIVNSVLWDWNAVKWRATNAN